MIYTISRLKSICSTKELLELDINLLKMSFRYSGYPESIISKHFNKALNYRKVVKNDVPKKVFYFGVQYLNSYSNNFASNLKSIFEKCFPYFKIIPYFSKNVYFKFIFKIV